MLVAMEAGTGLTKFSLFSALLTMEGLLFAGLTVSVTLSAAAPFGRQIAIRPAVLAFGAALLVGVVALAAVLAWTDLFLGANWPHGLNGRIEAVALLLAIVAPPIIALALAIGILRG